MNKKLGVLIRHRILVAVFAYLVVFLSIIAVSLLTDPGKPEVARSDSSVSVRVAVGPEGQAILSSPLTVSVIGLTSIAIVGWIIFSNRAAGKLSKDN